MNNIYRDNLKVLLKRETAQEDIWTRHKTPLLLKNGNQLCGQPHHYHFLWEGRRKEGGSNYYNKKQGYKRSRIRFQKLSK